MDDDKIKGLFSDFTPELSPDELIMSALQRNISAVESVRQQHVALRRRSRVAVLIAACVGFLTGVIFSLLLPMITNWIISVRITLPFIDVASVDYSFMAWILMAGVSALTALNAYEIAMVRLPFKRHD